MHRRKIIGSAMAFAGSICAAKGNTERKEPVSEKDKVENTGIEQPGLKCSPNAGFGVSSPSFRLDIIAGNRCTWG